MTALHSPDGAKIVLLHAGLDYENPPDFHSLRSDIVTKLAAMGHTRGYKAPKNASGSYARYWYAYVCKMAAREK